MSERTSAIIRVQSESSQRHATAVMVLQDGSISHRFLLRIRLCTHQYHYTIQTTPHVVNDKTHHMSSDLVIASSAI